MARAAFNADLDLRQQYLSLVYHKQPGELAWTLIDQGRVITPAQTAEEQEYSRIGDQNKSRIAGTISTDVTVQIYVEDDFEEVARFLGERTFSDGETVQLDPTVIADLAIVNFDGITTAANILFTEYINRFRPLQFSINLDAEGDVRIAELSGAADDYYIIKGSTSFVPS